MIDAAGVHKKYGEVAALSGVSISVGARQALGLVGPNGAGKSSLLRILCGLSRPDAGTARLDGFDPMRDPVPARRQVGCVPEHPPLFDLLTGSEQLMWAGRVQGIPDAALIERIEELSAALLHDPRVLILDEPFEGVDVVAVDTMKAVIRQFIDNGAAVLLSSHILGLVEDVGTQFAVLNGGRIVFEGNQQMLALEAAKLTSGSVGRQLESVFMDRVAPNRVAQRLTTLAGGGRRPSA